MRGEPHLGRMVRGGPYLIGKDGEGGPHLIGKDGEGWASFNWEGW